MKTLKRQKSNEDNYLAKLAVSKSILKEYNTSECTRTVYLNDGDEFQIQLFNPETVEIGVKIYIDNEPLSNVIVLSPGERMWLERYTDKAKKFRFRVYTVDGESEAVEKAIAHNGEVKVYFYKSKKKPDYCVGSPDVHVYHHYTYEYPWRNIYYCNDSITGACDVLNYCSSATTASNDANTVFTSTTTGDSGKTRSRSLAKNISCDISASSAAINTLYSSFAATPEPAAFNYKEYSDGSSCASFDGNADLDLIETGRVSEGGYSGQKFETVNIDLESWYFKEETIKILPYSRKPYTVNDSKKVYCPNCGRKLNTKFKFCPYCGEEI